MPSLIDIRRRVRAVKSTQQITKAMKAVSASKLRRAQDRILGARPFAVDMLRVLNSVAARVDTQAHPLLEVKPDGRTLLIVVTSDKGLCGSFNTNILKAAGQFITDRPADPGHAIALGLVGRKGRDFFRRRGFDVLYEDAGLFTNLKFAHAQALAKTAIEEFTGGGVNAVYVVYNEFKPAMAQRVVVEKLLPIPRLEIESADSTMADYLYEPAPEVILGDLLPHHVEIQVYRAMLESAAAEHAARMSAMDAATRNASEMLEDLTLYMNKVRQAAITREIIEIVAGAQSV